MFQQLKRLCPSLVKVIDLSIVPSTLAEREKLAMAAEDKHWQ